MQNCPKCGHPLSIAIVNGTHALICPNCMTRNGMLLIDMTSCNKCGKYYFKELEKVCECETLEE